MLDASVAETGFVHPADAICAGVVESSGCFDEHVEAHEKAEGVLRAVVVDDALVDENCTACRDRVVGFAQKHLFGVEIPVVKDVAHHHDIGLRDRCVEEAAGLEVNARREAVGSDVFLEDGADRGQIEADALKMRMGERDLRDEVALCSAYVDDRLVLLPGKLTRDRQVGSVTDAGHRAQEVAEAIGLSVERFEGIVAAVARFVLGFACAERGGEVAPEMVETGVGHLEQATDVGGLVLVEKVGGARGVGVVSVVALEAVEGDESVEEVAGRARMKADAAADAGEGLRTICEHGEELEFNSAEQDLGGKEAGAQLEQVVRNRAFHRARFLIFRHLGTTTEMIFAIILAQRDRRIAQRIWYEMGQGLEIQGLEMTPRSTKPLTKYCTASATSRRPMTRTRMRMPVWPRTRATRSALPSTRRQERAVRAIAPRMASSSQVDCTWPTRTMTVAMLPGPASIGMPMGTMPASSLVAAA